MKQCPQCKRTYTDETLNFCLDDGTTLNIVPAADTSENIPRPTEQKTEILATDQVSDAFATNQTQKDQTGDQETVVRSQPVASETSQPQIIRQGVNPLFAYLTVGLLALLVLIAGVALIVWMNSDSPTNTNSNLQLTQNLSNENNGISDTIDANAENGNLDIETSKTDKPTPKPTTKNEKEEKTETPKPTEKPKPTQTPTPVTTPTPTKTPTPDKGKYFVILGSFPRSQPGKARLRLQRARSRGLNARIINTNNFPNLRNGLIAVVVGPLSKSDAQNALRRARSVSSDAYIKAG